MQAKLETSGHKSLSQTIAGFFQARDELALGNIRRALLPVLLVFPLTVILGDLRYFDLKISVMGYESYELMLFPLGLGWLFLVFTPKRMIIPLLRITAVLCALLLPLQIFMQNGELRLALFMAFQFFNGVCAACAFSLFCFELNNVERLFGMALIQLYYGFYYTIWRAFPAVQAAGKTWGSAAIMALYLVVVFSCAGSFSAKSGRRRHEFLSGLDEDGKDSAVPFILVLDIIYYVIMCMINYIEWKESSVSSMAFGLGAAVSVVLVIVIQLRNNRNAMYNWLLFLALSLLGLGSLLYDSPVTLISGSFAYGLGDGLGYIIIYYICAVAIKRSKSIKMFKLYCLMFFVQYVVISGVFSVLFKYINAPNKVLAFAVVVILGSLCFLLLPLLQKKLFEIDWTDGLHLQDMALYTHPLEETEAIKIKDSLNLTSREQEIFTMLLTGANPKEIAGTLKISYHTLDFHRRNLYRKLGIQSRTELFARYSTINLPANASE